MNFEEWYEQFLEEIMGFTVDKSSFFNDYWKGRCPKESATEFLNEIKEQRKSV